MRLWVRSEYAAELAVVSAWMAALIPWNVTYATLPSAGDLVFVRFPLFQVRYAFGVPFARAIDLRTVYGAYAFQSGSGLADAYAAWLVGGALVALAVLLSFALYAAEERLRPARPVTLMGALLSFAGLAHAVAFYRLLTDGFPGVPVPLGVLFQLVFGVVLLAAQRS